MKDGDTVMKQVVNVINLKIWNESSGDTCSHTNKEWPVVDNISPTSPPAKKRKKQKSTTTTKTTTTAASGSDDNVITVTDDVTTETMSGYWKKNLNLKDEDKKCTVSGDWLNDKIIDAVNTLVARHIGGDVNQSVVMSQKNFDPVQMECIQIIHDHHHWVVSSYTGGSVRYADSLDRKLSEYVIQQLRQLYARCIDRQKDVLNIEVVPCQ